MPCSFSMMLRSCALPHYIWMTYRPCGGVESLTSNMTGTSPLLLGRNHTGAQASIQSQERDRRGKGQVSSASPEGIIRDYVKEFTELLLEIFVSCSYSWTASRLGHPLTQEEVQNVANAIRVVESLIEFKKESSKERPAKKGNNTTNEGVKGNKGKAPEKSSKKTTE